MRIVHDFPFDAQEIRCVPDLSPVRSKSNTPHARELFRVRIASAVRDQAREPGSSRNAVLN